ncbi:MAG: oligopeptidase B [candidate division Zixibacteria bacterium HGW-Zixibacteria-1]|nr:MAG: oligopeptidase B [candidate division Zixibacteria bacterium HGW-Zixibacteria-1]
MSANNCTSEPKPPVAVKVVHADTVLTHERVDNYFWLRDKENPDVIAYLETENAYTEQMMKHTKALQESLYDEILGRIKETDLSVPVKEDDYYYYSRTEEGKQYAIYCRKKGSLEAEEEILLDVNKLAEGKDFYSLDAFVVSPDHKLLAYAADEHGNEHYNIFFKNLETGGILPDTIKDASNSLQWANDNKTVFYTIYDEIWRPYKLFRHKLGEDPKNDVLVYHEPDDGFWMDIAKTKNKKFLIMVFGNKTTSEMRILEADNPTGEFRLVHPRQQDMKYAVESHGNDLYILTNDNDAKNFKLMMTSDTKLDRKFWKEVIPHSLSVKLDDYEVFKDHLVVYARQGGLPIILIRNLKTGEEHNIAYPEQSYSVYQNNNPDFNTNILRFTYESMVTPNSVYDYDMDTRERELKKRKEVLGGYNPDDYQIERVFAETDDSAMVPISIVYRKGLVMDGTNPCMLYGYGSYGISTDPWFSVARVSLLDRGFVYAIAQVRGGGEMGRYWYDDGKMLKKMNTFTDFIACAEHMINEKYTSSDKLIIGGGSAGGLLVGVVLNMRPDLFKAAVADVPFVDVVNTMLDESIPLTVFEYEEWGNPNQEPDYDYMMSYSPYDNVRAMAYPDILITAGLNDTRVQYWEPAKWTAKLRAMKTDKNRLLLKTTMGAGHAGVSGRYQRIQEIAFEYAFMFDVLGIKK